MKLLIRYRKIAASRHVGTRNDKNDKSAKKKYR
jgi:hypothetical protein